MRIYNRRHVFHNFFLLPLLWCFHTMLLDVGWPSFNLWLMLGKLRGDVSDSRATLIYPWPNCNLFGVNWANIGCRIQCDDGVLCRLILPISQQTRPYEFLCYRKKIQTSYFPPHNLLICDRSLFRRLLLHDLNAIWSYQWLWLGGDLSHLRHFLRTSDDYKSRLCGEFCA